jgi:oxalate decarboxylase/phosphoglucose isomerase-like protein (cupin superfamily)
LNDNRPLQAASMDCPLRASALARFPLASPARQRCAIEREHTGLATLDAREATATEGATLYIPPNTRVSLKNTGKEPLNLVFIFPRPEMVFAYYRDLTVAEGQPAIPFSTGEFAAVRARQKGHVMFDK